MNLADARLALFIICILCISLTFSYSGNPADYLYEGENPLYLSNSTITFKGENYTLYSIGGKEIFLIKNNSFVKNLDEIKKVLNEKCFVSNYITKSEIEKIRENVLAFNASRNSMTRLGPSEKTCMMYTGQDRAECYDITSCNNACALDYACFAISQGAGMEFFDNLLAFSKIRKGFDGNVTLIMNILSQLDVSSSEEINFNVSEKLNSIYNSISSLDSLSRNLTALKLFKTPEVGGYGICFPPTYNTTALSSSTIIISGYIEKSACFEEVNNVSSKILNETLSREEYYLTAKKKVALQNKFDSLSERFNELKLFGAEIKSIFVDEKIDEYVNEINNISQKYYYDMAAGYYDLASSDLVRMEEKIDNFEAYLNTSNVSYSKLKSSIDKVMQKIDTINLIIRKDDPAYEEVKKINLSMEKIKYEEVDGKVNELDSIREKLDEIIERKKKFEATRAPSFFAGIAKSISVPILESISDPLGVKEEEKKYWITGIPLLVMLVADVLILAILFILFFFIVLKKQAIFMKGKVLQSWAVIFGVIIVLLLGVTFAINSLISMETGPVSLISFVEELKKSDSIYILPQYPSGMNET